MEKANNFQLEISRKQKSLSQNQQLFNSLTKRIEKLEREIASSKAHYNNLLEYYLKEIEPLETEKANYLVEAAEAIDSEYAKFKISKNQKEDIQDNINELLDEAFKYIIPNAEQEALYNKWAYSSYKEELEFQENIEKEMMNNFMKNTYGIDFDMDDFDNSPEGFAKFQERIKSHLEDEHKRFENKTKSKKQLQKEEAVKAEEAIKNKSLRNIYIALVKVLHPDSEIDETVKLQKEHLMKRVTVAYEQKDLPTLLKLEMEWVHKTSEHLEKLTDEKLKIYISVLRQQVQELESEKYGERLNPKYSRITDLMDYSKKNSYSLLKLRAAELQKEIKDFKKTIKDIRTSTSKKLFMQYAGQLFANDDDLDDYDFVNQFVIDVPDFFEKKSKKAKN